MTTIRSILYFLVFVISTVIIASLGVLVGWLLPPMKRFVIDTTWSRFNLWALKWICGLSHRVVGIENIPDEPCIILAKHQSTWETIALISLIPHPKVWVIKRELLFIPIFGWIMILFRAIAIDRKSGRHAVKQVVELGTQRLRSGLSVIIFPEGTRVAPGIKKRFGIGGALLAEKSGYPVLPIAHNAGVFWKRRGINKYPGVIDVAIGPLIQTQSLDAKQINEQVEDWIESTVAGMPMEWSESKV